MYRLVYIERSGPMHLLSPRLNHFARLERAKSARTAPPCAKQMAWFGAGGSAQWKAFIYWVCAIVRRGVRRQFKHWPTFPPPPLHRLAGARLAHGNPAAATTAGKAVARGFIFPPALVSNGAHESEKQAPGRTWGACQPTPGTAVPRGRAEVSAIEK